MPGNVPHSARPKRTRSVRNMVVPLVAEKVAATQPHAMTMAESHVLAPNLCSIMLEGTWKE